MGHWYKRGNRYWIKYRDAYGRLVRESSGSTLEAEAKRLLRLREGDAARGVPVAMPHLRFADLAADVVTDYQLQRRRTTDDVERRLRLHILPVFGARRASAILTADLRTFAADRSAAGASAAEINRELAIIKRAFSLGVQNGLLHHRPHVPLLREGNVRSGFFEPAQFAAVRARLHEPLRALLTFAYVTGWRIPSEVLGLQWRQVDFVGGVVRLDPGTTKNGEGRVFPMTTELRELLTNRREATRACEQKQGEIIPWVFHRDGVPIRDFRAAFRKACTEAACPGRIPHDLRRTAVRNLVRAGVPERVAMTLTGHKTRSVFERYNIVSHGDLMDAARRLDVARAQPGV